MHYYQHNIGDYRRDTSHLSLLEHGIYRTLLDLYYLNETPIPKETEWVIRRLSAKTNDEILAIQAVLKDFFLEDVDGYRHKRCDMEIREYTAKADTARHNGKSGGRPKKTQPVILGNPDITQVKANHEPLTINQEPLGEGITPPTAAKRATRKCPVDFLITDDMRTWASLECPTVDVDKATAKFADHTFKTAKSDWPATWRNWLRQDAEQAAKSASLPAWREQQRAETQKAVPRIALGVVNPNTFFAELGASNVTALKLG